jgi:hypothetical protein
MVITLLAGATVSAVGATPNEHLHCAVMHTA